MLEGNLMQSSRIKRITDTKVEHVDDLLAVEAPLMIQLRYGPADVQTEKDISVTMRTPGNDAELALGFLFTEGIISDINQVEHVGIDPGENRVVVSLREGEMPSLPATDRNFYTTSSCGVCGKSSIDAIRTLPAAA